MTIETTTDPGVVRTVIAGSLPSTAGVLAVTARPGQESTDLGGLLYAFRRSRASVSLLCLTRGEGAGQAPGTVRLEAARPWEVQMAAFVLGVGQVSVASYRDGSLQHYRTVDVAGRILRAVKQYSAGLVLVSAPETGDIADNAVARAATAAALQAGVPAVARTRPGVPGAWMVSLGTDAATVRAVQKSAAAAHVSQAEELPGLISRIDQFGSAETLRWLVTPARAARAAPPSDVHVT